MPLVGIRPVHNQPQEPSRLTVFDSFPTKLLKFSAPPRPSINAPSPADAAIPTPLRTLCLSLYCCCWMLPAEGLRAADEQPHRSPQHVGLADRQKEWDETTFGLATHVGATDRRRDREELLQGTSARHGMGSIKPRPFAGPGGRYRLGPVVVPAL